VKSFHARAGKCRLRVTNCFADNMSGTSAVPQIPDDFGALRKSADVGQIRTLALQKETGAVVRPFFHKPCMTAFTR
jgi:hypothetical protein